MKRRHLSISKRFCMNGHKVITVHQVLTWVAGLMSTLTAALVLWVSGSFIDMRDTLIRMETLPKQVEMHEMRLGVLE